MLIPTSVGLLQHYDLTESMIISKGSVKTTTKRIDTSDSSDIGDFDQIMLHKKRRHRAICAHLQFSAYSSYHLGMSDDSAASRGRSAFVEKTLQPAGGQ